MNISWISWIFPMLFCVCFTGAFEHYTPDEMRSCNEENFPRVRTFKDLKEYQENSVSFIVDDGEFAGNYVEISQKNFTVLSRDGFLGKTSQYVIKLDLTEKEILAVEEGAFYYLDCLKYLNLQENKLKEISSYTFQGLVRLVELNLSGNALDVIHHSSFNDQKNLKYLDLSHNGIRWIEKFAFIDLGRLRNLDLNHNRLVEVGQALNEVPVLGGLDLSWNQIKHPDFLLFEGLENLEFLDISWNLIEKWNFTKKTTLASLLELRLGNNRISQVAFKFIGYGYPQLRHLDLVNNSMPCEKMSWILEELDATRVVLEEKDNPCFAKPVTTSEPPTRRHGESESTRTVLNYIVGISSIIAFVIIIYISADKVGLWEGYGRNRRGSLEHIPLNSVD